MCSDLDRAAAQRSVVARRSGGRSLLAFREQIVGAMSMWMAERQRKLSLQAEEATSTLFRGLTFYFNGRSGEMGVLRLSKLVQRYGGRTTPGQSASTSYIIGTGLSGTKTHRYLKHKSWKAARSAAMLRPEWLHACIAAGTLVPVTAYLVVHNETQNLIDTFVERDGSAAAGAAAGVAAGAVVAAEPLPAAPTPATTPIVLADRRTSPRLAPRASSKAAARPSRRVERKLAAFRDGAKRHVAAALERFDRDAAYQAKVFAQHADRASFAAAKAAELDGKIRRAGQRAAEAAAEASKPSAKRKPKRNFDPVSPTQSPQTRQHVRKARRLSQDEPSQHQVSQEL